MGSALKFLTLVYFAARLITGQSQSTICTSKPSQEVNDSHPSPNNNWTDTEQLKNVTDFCKMGQLEIECKDEKGEFIVSKMKNTTLYIATCEQAKGLWCRPYGTNHCPDFSAVYTCKCPPTTALSTKDTTTTNKPTTNKASTNKATTNGTQLYRNASAAHISDCFLIFCAVLKLLTHLL